MLIHFVPKCLHELHDLNSASIPYFQEECKPHLYLKLTALTKMKNFFKIKPHAEYQPSKSVKYEYPNPSTW